MTDDEIIEESRLIQRGTRLAEIAQDESFLEVLQALREDAFSKFANPNSSQADVGASRAIAMALQGIVEQMSLFISEGDFATQARIDRQKREEAALKMQPHRRNSDRSR